MTVFKRCGMLSGLLALVVPLAATAQTSPTEMQRRAVVTEKMAYIALPPELVAEPVVTGLSVSGGGRYALAQRMKLQITAEMLKPENSPQTPPHGEISLILWDSRAHLSTTVWRADASEAHIDQVTWLPKAEVAYVKVEHTVLVHPDAPQGAKTTRLELLRISPFAGRAETIGLADHADAEMMELIPSPTLPLSVVKLMFTQDNDEILPGADGLVSNLMPYAKDGSVFDGFNYTYPGGPLSDIENPSQTVIGTMNGPGGQAVIYVDGHVKWR